MGDRISKTCRQISIFLAVTALAITTSRFASAGEDREHQHEDLGPGCASHRRAIAHRAGGRAESPIRREDAPIPCVSNTGLRTGESPREY